MYQYYNPNPDRRNVGDCAVRAVAAACGLSWTESYDALCEMGRIMHDMPSANSVWGAFLHDQGFVKENLPTSCIDGYTVRDFAHDYSVGVYVLALSGHVVTVIDGNYLDSWDSGDEIVIYDWRG